MSHRSGTKSNAATATNTATLSVLRSNGTKDEVRSLQILFACLYALRLVLYFLFRSHSDTQFLDCSLLIHSI